MFGFCYLNHNHRDSSRWCNDLSNLSILKTLKPLNSHPLKPELSFSVSPKTDLLDPPKHGRDTVTTSTNINHVRNPKGHREEDLRNPWSSVFFSPPTPGRSLQSRHSVFHHGVPKRVLRDITVNQESRKGPGIQNELK